FVAFPQDYLKKGRPFTMFLFFNEKMSTDGKRCFYFFGIVVYEPPASQCSLIARSELTYGPCLEGPNDRTNHACREKGVGGLDVY
ncbi:hypothetical protein XENOCAPTIV_028340, partial [Xenoophorus captivus]